MRKARRPPRHATQRRAFVQRRTKKRTTPRPQTAHRGQGSIATTRATCDVRAELRLVHWAWRGRDSPAPQEHDGGLGSYFFSSVECTHRPLLRGYHHGHISRVAFLSCVLFSRHAACSCGGRRLALCTWPTGQGACCQTRRLSEDRGGLHHFRPFYDHPADRRSQVVAGRPT